MNADQLLDLYDRVAESPDAISRLRRFVLDLAVRGKLVEQDAAEKPETELVKQLAKLRPIQDVQIKNWVAAKLGDIIELRYGKGLDAKLRQDAGAVPIFGSNGIVGFTSSALTERPSIVVGRKGSAGALNICDGPSWTTDVAYFVEIPPFLSLRYLHSLLASLNLDGLGKGVKPGLSRADAYALPVMVPPLAEQHRIVAKVDELMALLDRLEQARAGREALRDQLTTATLNRLTQTDPEAFQPAAHFALQTLPHLTTRPDQIKTLRQTILNLAVRGKLVEQDATDEPASELMKRIAKARLIARKRSTTFPSVSQEEEQFISPASWQWQRFGEVFSIKTGFAFQSPTYSDKGVLVLRVVNFDRSGAFDFSDAKFYPAEKIDEKISQFLLREGEILMVMVGGTIGKTTVVSRNILPALLNQNMWRIRSYGEIMNGRFEHMLITYLNRTIENITQSTHGHFAMSDFEQKVVCIPPLAEQHRIVARVDALMALCDQLEAGLAGAEATRTRLLDALLHAALDPATDLAEAAE